MYCSILLFIGSMGKSHFEDHQKKLLFSKLSKIDQVMVNQVRVLAARSGEPFLERTTLSL
jgi:hypothetical protein